MIERLEGGISKVEGVKTAGIRCGIKSRGKDLALIYSEYPATYACAYTDNKLKSASLLFNMKKRASYLRAIIVNSGCANTCTGKKGIEDVKEIVLCLSKELSIPPSSIFFASTGRIGEFLPKEKIKAKIPLLVKRLSSDDKDAALAILTTDKNIKRVAVKVKIDGDEVKIGGIAKGAGMIHPHLCTMLAFIATDAVVEKELLHDILIESLDTSFNSITVDGERSPNDFVVFFANGATKKEIKKRNKNLFLSASRAVFEALSYMIVEDAEGATKVIELQLSGAKTKEEARKAGLHILTSPLVKAALFGGVPNWGRIMARLGTLIDIKEEKVDIYINGYAIVKKGVAVIGEGVKEELSKKNIQIQINLGRGKAKWTVRGCDLSPEYVKLNVF